MHRNTRRVRDAAQAAGLTIDVREFPEGTRTAEDAAAVTGFPIGGTAPLGHATPLPVPADRDLLRFEAVWAAAGTPHHNFSAEPAPLFAAAGAVVTDVATDPGGAASDVTRAGGEQA